MSPTHDLVLDALGNPTRRAILALLRDGAHPVASIAAAFPVSRPAISRHLKQLQAAGLVRSRRHGTANLYDLDRLGFEVARGWLDGFWTEALAGFQALAESTWEER